MIQSEFRSFWPLLAITIIRIKIQKSVGYLLERQQPIQQSDINFQFIININRLEVDSL